MVDAYGETGEDYPISMENRLDRMQLVTVCDVLEKVQVWRNEYAV